MVLCFDIGPTSDSTHTSLYCDYFSFPQHIKFIFIIYSRFLAAAVCVWPFHSCDDHVLAVKATAVIRSAERTAELCSAQSRGHHVVAEVSRITFAGFSANHEY